MVVNRGSLAEPVPVVDAFKRVSQLDEYLLLVGRLLASLAYVYFVRRPVGGVGVEVDVRVVFLQPVIRLLVLHAHVALLNYDNEDVHYHSVYYDYD